MEDRGMAEDGPQRPGAWPRDRIGTRHHARILMALVGAMVAFSIAPIANGIRGKSFNKDYTLWYRIGRIVLQGGELYPTDGRPFPFMYPPPCASLLAILSLAGEVPMIVVLTVVNSAAWLASILLATYLATGRAFRRHPLLYLAPTLAVGPYVHDIYLLGQPNLLLLAFMLGAFACLRIGRSWGAGALIALAAAVKAFPLMAVGYLVYRRHWKATAVALVVLTALLLALPVPFRGAARAWGDLETWTSGMVLKYDAGRIAQRPERSYSFKNQSLIALANRLLRPIPADGEAKESWTVHVANLDFRTVNAAIVLSALGLCVALVAAMPRRDRRTERTDAIEFAMLLLLILFFSPLSFNYFYVWLLYPLTVVLDLILTAPRGSRVLALRIAWFVAVLVVLALPIPFPRVAQAYGSEFFAGLLLFAGLGSELRRAWPPTPAPAPGRGIPRPMGMPMPSAPRSA